MTSYSPRFAFALLAAAQALPETAVNELALILEAASGHLIFKDRDLSAPPGSPAAGDGYLIAASPTGAWTGQAGKIALFIAGAWRFSTPIEGLTAWINDEDGLFSYDGAAWNLIAAPSGAYQPLDADLTAIAALTTTSFGRSLLTQANAAAVRAAIGAGTGGGDLVSTNNLSDIGSAATARTNLGLGTAATQANSFFAQSANNLSDLANAGTARTNLGATTAGGNLFTLANPSAITFLRVNADNSVSALSASAFRTAIGAGVGDLVSTNNLSDLANAGTARTNLGLGTSATMAAEWAPNFTAAGDVYIPAVVAMTIDQGNAAIGTGTLAFAKSTTAAPGTFTATTLPATLQAGAWLKVSASAITGFVATHLKRTA